MAARAYWQGQIRLALVSIPVEIYSATKSGASISFRQIHEPTGKPVKYEKVVSGVGPVDRDEILKGYQIEKNRYILLEDAEIEAVRIESKRTLDLVQFVEADDIDVLYYEKPYFVVPADELAEEAYIVLREALRTSRKVGLGQLSVRGREHLVSLKPCGRGMILETLRYADEVHRAESYFRSIGNEKPDKELLSLATELIDKKTAPFDAGEFHDHYVEALMRVIDRKAKAKGKRVIEEEAVPATAGSNVIDLMAALKQSVAKGGEPASQKGRTGASRTRKGDATSKNPPAAPKAGPARRKRA